MIPIVIKKTYFLVASKKNFDLKRYKKIYDFVNVFTLEDISKFEHPDLVFDNFRDYKKIKDPMFVILEKLVRREGKFEEKEPDEVYKTIKKIYNFFEDDKQLNRLVNCLKFRTYYSKSLIYEKLFNNTRIKEPLSTIKTIMYFILWESGLYTSVFIAEIFNVTHSSILSGSAKIQGIIDNNYIFNNIINDLYKTLN